MWPGFEAVGGAAGDSKAMLVRKQMVLRRLAAVAAAVENWSTDPSELEDAEAELKEAGRLIGRMLFDFDPDAGTYPEER